jgi:hypothetical protein
MRKEKVSSLRACREPGCQFRAYDDQPCGVGVTQGSDAPSMPPPAASDRAIASPKIFALPKCQLHADPALLAEPYIRLKSLLAA